MVVERGAGGARGVVDPLCAGGGAGEIEAEVVGLGPQVIDHRLAEPGADPVAVGVREGGVDEVVQGGRHAAANGRVVPDGGVTAEVLLDAEPAVAERQRTGERRRGGHADGSEVGLHACDRHQALERHERRAVHLGDDRAAVGQLQADDDPDPRFVEPGRDDRHGERGRDALGEHLGHRRRVVRPEDRLHHSRHPPRVRAGDQPGQLLHGRRSSRSTRCVGQGVRCPVAARSRGTADSSSRMHPRAAPAIGGGVPPPVFRRGRSEQRVED